MDKNKKIKKNFNVYYLSQQKNILGYINIFIFYAN